MALISICIITKNEIHLLEECLKRLLPYGHEIVVLDTGSTDGTLQMVHKYTDKVFEYKWCNDFAAARNECISHASNEYILTVDSDEFLQKWDEYQLQEQITLYPSRIGRIQRIDTYTQQGETRKVKEGMGRLFSKRLFHYEGRIHEQIVPLFPDVEVGFYPLNFEFEHQSYCGDLKTRQKRSERNISLLKKELEEHSNDPYFLFRLGQAYFMEEDYVNAAKSYGQALEQDLNPQLEYVQSMVESYGYSLLYTKQLEKAIAFEQIYDTFAVNADFIFLMGLIYMNNGQFDKAVAEFQKAAGQSKCKVEGANSYRALFNIGVIYECLGDITKAQFYYKECGEFEPAKERLRRRL